MTDVGHQATPPGSHLAINPDPYRKRAQAMLSEPERTTREKALADVVVLMCDRYDELLVVFGVEAGQIVRWPGG
jgi:hypothetical protein